MSEDVPLVCFQYSPGSPDDHIVRIGALSSLDSIFISSPARSVLVYQFGYGYHLSVPLQVEDFLDIPSYLYPDA